MEIHVFALKLWIFLYTGVFVKNLIWYMYKEPRDVSEFRINITEICLSTKKTPSDGERVAGIAQ